ncbi:hypothetical protein WICMUC_004063 [Wickerhamomyces mucosus]|uniref:Nucleoside transporter FUN26 n=1 Tax=Wickerhamomyces mucosus TaxID=1378264 RepID=A0A9P8TBB8_9ASCO|nr:hypothetical protein WICMUC_004063 [Wickerhamomyces mucosus]
MTVVKDNRNDSIHYESLNQLESDPSSNTSTPTNQSTTQDITLFQFHSISLNLSDFNYITYLAVGISLLWPWNCFLSASEYFMYKFSDSPSLSNNYTSTMMTASTITSLLFNSYLSTKQQTNFYTRVKIGIIMNFVIFTILSFIELLYPTLNSFNYFIFLMLLVISTSIGTCYQQNGTMSIVNVMGPRFAQAVMVGQAIAGVLPSISLIFSNLSVNASAMSSEKRIGSKSIVIYFATTSLITLVAGLLFLISNNYSKESLPFEEEHEKRYVPFKALFEKLKFLVLSIFTVFLITLAFPVFASNIQSVHENSSSSFTKNEIFIPFIFFVWNLGDLLGRMSCSIPSLVISSDTSLFFYSLGRSGILPLFFFCNLQKSKLPFIKSDLFYIFLQFIFGLTNGHCLSCCFMNIGDYVDDDEREAAGGFSVVWLSLGLAAGSLGSYLIVAALN